MEIPKKKKPPMSIVKTWHSHDGGAAPFLTWIITLPKVMEFISEPSKRGYLACHVRIVDGYIHRPGRAIRPADTGALAQHWPAPLGERLMRHGAHVDTQNPRLRRGLRKTSGKGILFLQNVFLVALFRF